MLTDDTLVLYAIKHYDTGHPSTMEEFNDDFNRIKYIKRLLNRYKETGDLKVQLLINHIIIIYNVFGIEAATKILYYRVERELWDALTPFIIALGYFSESQYIYDVERDPIKTSMIPLDQMVVDQLREYIR